MCTKWTRASLLMLVMTAAPAAWADTATDKAPADPATKTLSAASSDTAKANAFGQQGARMRAAHQAAKAAAVQEAHKAADQGPQAGAVRPNANAQTHASATGVSHGFDRATAGAANGQATTHRPR